MSKNSKVHEISNLQNDLEYHTNAGLTEVESFL